MLKVIISFKAIVSRERQAFRVSFLFFFICLLLSACASSNVTRTAAQNLDLGLRNGSNVFSGGNGNMADTYDNISQRTKLGLGGAIVGGVAGSMTSSLGVLPGVVIGAVMGASYGGYIEANMSLRDKLINRGVNVIILGDQIMVVMQSSRLFNHMTGVINAEAYTTLYMVACFINKFPNVMVKVAAYTGDTGSTAIAYELSKQQAERVAHFLSESGLNTRILYASGMGCTRLVENSSCWDSDNFRIEITLERLHNCC